MKAILECARALAIVLMLVICGCRAPDLGEYRVDIADIITGLSSLSSGNGSEDVLRLISRLIRTMRPSQWTKNILFVFPAIVFSQNLFVMDMLGRVIVCCLFLILTSSCVYIINDVADIEADRSHPVKKLRPIAAGAVPTGAAIAAATLILTVVLLAAYQFQPTLALLLLGYFLVHLAYSFCLKHIVLLDILAVASGFVLRVMAGGLVIGVSVSPWLYSSAGMLALFLVIGKRRQELALLGETARESRPVFAKYNLPLLDDMLRIATTATLITYVLYTVDSGTMVRHGANLGPLTVPIVVYGLFRYLYLIHVEKEGSAPDEVLWTDRPLQLTILAAALAYFAILYLV